MLLVVFTGVVLPQTRDDQRSAIERRIEVGAQTEIVIRNPRGRVQVTTSAATDTEREVIVNATPASSAATLDESALVAERSGARLTITVADPAANNLRNERAPRAANDERSRDAERIDLTVRIPARANLRVETAGGAVDVVGDFRQVEARTTTGTIRVDVPSTNLRYDFEWTASRPRIYSLLDLAPPREGRGGRFTISGRFPSKQNSKTSGAKGAKNAKDADDAGGDDEATADTEANGRDRKQQARVERESRVDLRLTTERGVVIVGADPATVPADLRERTLTEAARAIIRGGDETLIERVRRLAPRLVDDYAGTLSTRRLTTPTLALRGASKTNITGRGARVVATVTDRAGRPLTDLTKEDFSVTSGGIEQEVVNVTPAEAPFNLVLLLDVSGSVVERLDFIRRAALRFVSTASPQDRVAVLTFRDDITNISPFTADRAELTRRINTIEAGGATALYDALGYVLLETLRALPEQERERTAIVVLSDGDDNRSFLAFDNIIDLTRETGTPVYPLYVPSGLIPATTATDSAADARRTRDDSTALAADPTRARLLTLTSVATQEGATLARTTGGVFYPVARLEDLQRAYDDIVRQLRTSYTITYRAPQTATPDATSDEGIFVRVRRPGAVVVRTSRTTN